MHACVQEARVMVASYPYLCDPPAISNAIAAECCNASIIAREQAHLAFGALPAATASSLLLTCAGGWPTALGSPASTLMYVCGWQASQEPLVSALPLLVVSAACRSKRAGGPHSPHSAAPQPAWVVASTSLDQGF